MTIYSPEVIAHYSDMIAHLATAAAIAKVRANMAAQRKAAQPQPQPAGRVAVAGRQ